MQEAERQMHNGGQTDHGDSAPGESRWDGFG
jgi:hypothetical protein